MRVPMDSIKVRPLHEEMIEMAHSLNEAASHLRRLGRGALKNENGSDSILSRHIYKFGDRTRIVDSFQRDICFETANRLEEYAHVLELLVRPREPLS